jgi:hypothetical protein
MSDVPPDITLQIRAGWNRQPRHYLLRKRKNVEYGGDLKWFWTGLDRCTREPGNSMLALYLHWLSPEEHFDDELSQ